MTNPTSNFGWQMPTSTDLVTDLPADFETFGQAVDTSLADLKGGTSGQILAKASNTDMDFTWVTNDVGDITAVTAGTGITGGGTSGAVTVSFDQANFGGGQYAAGKNKIINGDFEIWQRGTSFTNPSNGYMADRWQTAMSASAPSTYSITRQTFTPGTAPVSGYEGQYFVRATMPSSGTISEWDWFQPIEDVRTFAGQTVTLSFWAKSSSSTTLNLLAQQRFGSGGSGNVSALSGTASITTSWARYTLTGTIPSVAGKTIGDNSSLYVFLYSTTATNSQTIDIWGVQLEADSTATPFQTATGNPASELLACKYYFEVCGSLYGYALAAGTIQGIIGHSPKRTTPSVGLLTTTPYAESPINVTARTGSGSTPAGSPNPNMYGSSLIRIDGFSGMTAGTNAYITSDQITLSAEL